MLNLGNKKTMWWLGLILVIAVGLYVWSIKKITNDMFSTKIEKLELAHQQAKKQRDSANLQIRLMTERIHKLDKNLEESLKNSNRLHKDFERSIKKQEKIKNEKSYIPDNTDDATIQDYLSKYKYKEYK